MSIIVEQMRFASSREIGDMSLPLISFDPQIALEEFVVEAGALCAQFACDQQTELLLSHQS